ncbi:MAG: 16S rRNA (guanine(966)-N(2))-methyltransferase RsmD [Oscillospiraceae bacterium]|nr:16S rRNA (guanine(966)-N(2))-methyltransferase RsmD [Oscillospiraceae bacterium]
MRVITGSAKGTHLKTLEGLDVRPTTDRVKEGMFSSIQFDLAGSTVLDLFAGSGQLGIEALSRGAKQAVFVDHSPQAIKVIKENLEKTGFTSKAQVYQKESEQFFAYCPDRFFDFIFLDPPYRKDILQEILPNLAKKLKESGKMICEHEKDLEMPEKIFNLRLKKEYFYGKIVVSVYAFEEEESE